MVLFLDFPRPFQKGFPSEIVFRHPFLLQLTFNDILRGNSGVIGSRHPQRRFAEHTVVADQNVLQ